MKAWLARSTMTELAGPKKIVLVGSMMTLPVWSKKMLPGQPKKTVPARPRKVMGWASKLAREPLASTNQPDAGP
jgi:hypothetical protein